MNPKRIIFVFLVMFRMITLFSQRVVFTYDDNGNRLTRTITIDPLESKSVSFPVVDPKRLIRLEANAKGLDVAQDRNTSENANTLVENRTERTKSENGEIVTIVYPNPNMGLVKIDISNMPLNSTTDMRLYDLSGNTLIIRTNIESQSEIDIHQYKDGIYILRVKVNGKIFNWKVVKNSY